LKIGFVGAGKVGFSLGKYFSINNITLSGYYSKHLNSAKEAANFTNSNFYNTIYDLINDSDIIFITTPDDVVSSIWQEIKSLNIRNKLICHTSGSLTSEIFSDINGLGASAYSVHPMFPFSDKLTTYKHLSNCYFSLEGNEKHLTLMKKFLESLGNTVFTIEANKKALYHLSNVMVSNLVLSLINKGCSYLSECGLQPTDALSALMPLIESNLNNLKTKGFICSLTGPVERGDLGTISKHLEVIPQEDAQIYKNLSLNLMNLSSQKHPEKDYAQIKQILGGTTNEEFSRKLQESKIRE
jgi:predicted short-subunit dehydrogenase-like oxidoreductase (DUF2520 family)